MIFGIYLLTGLMLIGLGYLIKYKGWSSLIAGYNTSSKEEKAKYDVEALCSFMGKFMFVLGGILVLAGVAAYYKVSWIVSISWIVFAVISIGSLIYMNTGNRFKKNEGE